MVLKDGKRYYNRYDILNVIKDNNNIIIEISRKCDRISATINHEGTIRAVNHYDLLSIKSDWEERKSHYYEIYDKYNSKRSKVLSDNYEKKITLIDKIIKEHI